MILKSLRLKATIIYYIIACILIISTIPEIISARTSFMHSSVHSSHPSASFTVLDQDEDLDETIYLKSQPYRPSLYHDSWSDVANREVDLQSQQTEANALCAFKQGINNWPGSRINGIYKCDNIIGWNCSSGAVAASYPCNVNFTWTGVTCNSGFVSYLNLSSCGFNGTISSQLSVLTELKYLWLRINSFSGSIPSAISALSKLQSLNLRTNSLTGQIPSQITALRDLRELILLQNSLNGSILPPNACSTLKNLTYINLRLNKLSQTIPSDISLLSKLTYLNIRLNKIVGQIPSSLSVLTGLTELLVRNNLLTGTLPSQLSTLTNLKFLNPNVNRLIGSIPSQLSTLIKLNTLYLNENRFSSTIPSELSALTSLTSLSLHSNRLSGSIPKQLSNLTSLTTLFIAKNKLIGSIPPSFSALSNLENLLMYSNDLTGRLPDYISSFKKLTLLSMAFNKFTSLIPDIFGELSHLEILQLNNNKLNGELPSSLSKLGNSLTFLDLSSNQLKGDPFFFIGFPYILFVNISSNRFSGLSRFRSSSYSSSSNDDDNNNTASTLHYLDMSNNYFEKTLPDNFWLNFPSLKVLSASNNCFESFIPESLCKLSNLSSILLNKLGSQCISTDVSVILNTFSDVVVNSRHTIPSCLLSLPHLQTAHLIGNYLLGTLSEVSSSLESLSLVGNAIVGTIPESIQQSSKLTDLQLSLNRLSGTLIDDAFLNLPSNSIIQLYSNRISGNLPSSLNHLNNSVDILAGNLFYCTSIAPKNLMNYETYSCGSSSIDYYGTVYTVIGVCLALMLLALLVVLRNVPELESLFRFSKSLRSLSSSPSVNIEKELPFFYIFYKIIPFPRRPLYSAICNPHFIATCLVVALVNTVFNLVIYNIDYSKDEYDGFSGYSTHEFQYGYSSTFTYCHGKLPYSLVTGSLTVTIFVYLYYFDDYNKAASGDTDSRHHLRDESMKSRISIANEEEKMSPPSLIGTSIAEPTSAAASTIAEESISRMSRNGGPFVNRDSNYSIDNPPTLRLTLNHGPEPTFIFAEFFTMLSNNAQFRWFLSLQLINVVVVTIVNVFYIFLETDLDSTSDVYIQNRYKYVIPIVYSIFKIVWSETFVTFMVKYGLKIQLSEYVVFGHFIFSLLYINILVPIITVFFTDVNCFYYQLRSIPLITEKFEGYNSTTVCTIDGCVSNFKIIDITQSIEPSWIYGYQCSFSTMINYIPAVLSKYTIVGIFIPILKLAILYFPSTSWIRNAPGMNMFMQYSYNAMPGDDLMTNSVQRQFRTLRHIGKSVCDVLMLFTFGIFCPFLTFIIVPSIIFNELVNHLQLGSYLRDRMCFHRAKKAGDYTEAEKDELLSCVYSSNSRKLMRSMWKPSVLTILFFSTLFFFDFIADSFSNTAGIIAVLVNWIYFIVFFYSRSRLDRIVNLFTTFMSSFRDLRAQNLGRHVNRTSISLEGSKQGPGSGIHSSGAGGLVVIDNFDQLSSPSSEIEMATFNEILNRQEGGV